MAEANGSDHEVASTGLFSMVASDNAEVIPEVAPRGPETMWSVAANAETDLREPHATQNVRSDVQDSLDDIDSDGHDVVDEVVDGRFDDDHTVSDYSTGAAGTSNPPPFSGWDAEDAVQDTASGPFRRTQVDSLGSIFTAEPVDHMGDVVDEAELVDDTSWNGQSRPSPDGSLFSNGSHLHSVADARRPSTDARDRDPSAASRTDVQDPWIITDRSWAQPSTDDAWASLSDEPGASSGRNDMDRGTPHVLDDPQGFETAILRVHPQERERAHVPLSVCGALLHEDELVLGVVTGQMLGRPAAVVVTEDRVLVVNDRRWQPVVDIFPIDGELVVRGRHDREIAALSFADPTRVSMVDGISDVAIAIELAEHIRDAGPRGAS